MERILIKNSAPERQKRPDKNPWVVFFLFTLELSLMTVSRADLYE